MSIPALIENARLQAGLTQRELAARAGTAQSVVARIERKQANPTIETVRRLLDAAGFALRVDIVPKAVVDATVEAYKKDVDRTLLRGNLEQTPDQRIRALVSLQRFGKEVQRAVRQRKRGA